MKIRWWKFWKWKKEVQRLRAVLSFSKQLHSIDLEKIDVLEDKICHLKTQISAGREIPPVSRCKK